MHSLYCMLQRLSSPVTGIIRNARNVVLLSLCTIVLMFVINMAIKVCGL